MKVRLENGKEEEDETGWNHKSRRDIHFHKVAGVINDKGLKDLSGHLIGRDQSSLTWQWDWLGISHMSVTQGLS